MYFHFTWIKDTIEKNYTLDFLVEGNDVLSVRTFLSEEKVITLGLDEYKDDPKAFWDFYAVIKSKSGATGKLIGKEKTLDTFIAFLVKLGFNIEEANGYKDQKKKEEVTAMIEKHVKIEEEHQAYVKRLREEAEKKNQLSYDDGRLKKSYVAIDEVVNQIDQLLLIWGNKILPETRKKFDDMRWEIAKLRLATNIDKIVEELHKALNLILDTQDYILWKLDSEKVFSVVAGSELKNIDVIREQTKLFKARLLSTLWASLSAEEAGYVSLGYVKVYAPYLLKDFNLVLQDKLAIARNIFWGLELMILFVLLEMVILSVFWSYIWINLSLQRYWIIFIYLAILGWLFRIVNVYIRPNKLYIYGICLFGIALIYSGFMYAIKIILVF